MSTPNQWICDMWHHPRLLSLVALASRARTSCRRRSTANRRAQSSRSGFYAQAWREAAERLGGSVEHLGGEVYEITVGDVRTRVCRNETPLDDPVTLMVAGDKPLVYRLLAACGLPVPEHLEFGLDTIAEALEFLQRVRGECVVKPARDTGAGHGVTTRIAKGRQLTWAAATAAALDDRLLIERFVPGHVFRLLYLDGLLLDAVLRRPPAVKGDGRTTVRGLLARTNAERLAGGGRTAQVLVPCDGDMRRTLAKQGWSLRSVPPEGVNVVLKTVVNDNAAWENEAAVGRLCPAVVEAGALAAGAVGVRLAGVDVVTPDPGRALADAGGVVLEVNTTPGFHYHYHRQGDAYPVALRVLECLCAGESRTTEWRHAWLQSSESP